MTNKKVLLAVGGTAGHVFPAQGLARELLEQHPEMELLFAGKGLSTNPYFDKSLYICCDVESLTPFRGNPFKALCSLFRGVVSSMKLLAKEKPQLVVGFGSFHAFPLLCAAVLKKIPFVLFESNAIPGKVVRLFSKKALFTGIYFSGAQEHLKGKTIEVEIPTRKKDSFSREEAHRQLSLDPQLITLLAFGGSQGAKQVNETLLKTLPLLHQADFHFQLIHFTGDEKSAEEMRTECARLGMGCYIKKFELQMALAWSAADLVICRAGAMTLSELLHHEVPGILIPYPFASDQHQLKNALFIENTVQGAVHLPQSSLSAELLSQTILSLVKERRGEMREAIRRFNQTQIKKTLSQLVTEIL
jgi:UDP-N-acetylglucosamine--N-acetylmuramyl-(pentapeptide) pyrophosphoryl-undecaprenol N-acetylglucosamine transferase